MNLFIYSQCRNAPSFSRSKNQSGATLIIVLILLILITLFGIASVRSSLLQERMTSGTISNNAAFQAVEAGLRQGEAYLAGLPEEPRFPDTPNTCNQGLCSKYVPTVAKDDAPRWAKAGFWEDTQLYKVGDSVGKEPFAVIPKYVIEDFGKGESGGNTATDRGTAFEPTPAPPPKLYRITAYAKAPGTDAETILQSIYIR